MAQGTLHRFDHKKCDLVAEVDRTKRLLVFKYMISKSLFPRSLGGRPAVFGRSVLKKVCMLDRIEHVIQPRKWVSFDQVKWIEAKLY